MVNRQGRSSNHGLIIIILLLHFSIFSCGDAVGCSVEEATAVCGSSYPKLNVSFPFGFNSEYSVNVSVINNCTALPEFNLKCNDSANAVSWWPNTPNYGLNRSLANLISISSNQISYGAFVISTPTSASSNVCSFLNSSIYTASGLLNSAPRSIGLSFELCNNTLLFANCTNFNQSKLESDPYGISDYSNSSFCKSVRSDCLSSDRGSCLEAPRSACYSAESLTKLKEYARQTYGCESTEPLVLFQVPESFNISQPAGKYLQVQMGWAITQSYYDCVACRKSGGTCSSYNGTDVFQCTSCPAGTTNNSSLGSNVCAATSSSESSINFSVTLGGIAIASAIVVVASGIACYCCWSKSKGFGEAKNETERLRLLLSQLSSDYKAAARRNRAAAAATAANNHSSPLVHEPSTISCRVFTYKELMDATDDFSDSRLIGDGGFGMVYEGRIGGAEDDAASSASTRVAVKRLFSDNHRRMEQFVNEIRILSTVRHPNLVHLHGFCCEATLNELLLVYEFASNGSLADNIHGGAGKGLLWETRLSISLETASALAYLHHQNPPVVHRDVKSSNILLDDAFHAKLADFGLSRIWAGGVGHVSTAPQGTPGYVDPAYHQSYQLTEKSDVYSFGVVLTELITGKLPVDMERGQTDINLSSLAVSKIQTGALYEIVDPFLEVEQYPSIKDMVTRVAELALQCLAPVKDDRPSMDVVARDLHAIARSAGYISASSTCYNELQVSSSANGSSHRRRGSTFKSASSDSSLSETAASFDDLLNNNNTIGHPTPPPDLPFLILAT